MHTSFFKKSSRKSFFSQFFLPNFPPCQTDSNFSPFSSYSSTNKKKLDQALRILHLITPKTTSLSKNRQNHLRLLQDFVQTDSPSLFSKPHIDENRFVTSSDLLFDDVLENDDIRSNASVLSYAISSCAFSRYLGCGIQLHCVAILSGFVIDVYVGSSLINLYSKCSEMSDAYKVFDEMPVRNVVSWTAIIVGFAQEHQVDMCLNLYSRMRNSITKPNEFTFVTLLSACTGSGVLGQGMSTHCQTIRMGFGSYPAVANAHISMYCKCGNLDDAFRIFENMQSKDIVSWNSIIAGCSLNGLGLKALSLFEEMKSINLKPDAFTFLGILSSCRHVGLVEEGKFYFNSMVDYGVKPERDHYSCIVDLLGRAGLLEEAFEFMNKMPINPNAVIWGSLLSSCRVCGDVWFGIWAAEKRLLVEPGCAATHVQLANLYASTGMWKQAARVRKLMRERGLKTNPGYSWIEIKNEVYQFTVEDKTNSRLTEILNVVDIMVDHMRSLGYVPEICEQEFDDGTFEHPCETFESRFAKICRN